LILTWVGMTQVAVLIALAVILLGIVITVTNVLAVLRRARIRQHIPPTADIAFPQRFKDRVITETRPIATPSPETPPPMRRADLPTGQIVSEDISIYVEPDETGPFEVSAFRRYVDKDGTTRRDVRRIIDRLEDVKKAG